MAVSVAPLTTTVMGAVPDPYTGAASGINNAVARMAGMLAVAILGTVAVWVFGTVLDRRLAASDVSPLVRRAMAQEASRLTEARVPAVAGPGLQAEFGRDLAESFVASFRVIMLTAAALAVLSAVCAGAHHRREAPCPASE